MKSIVEDGEGIHTLERDNYNQKVDFGVEFVVVVFFVVVVEVVVGLLDP